MAQLTAALRTYYVLRLYVLTTYCGSSYLRRPRHSGRQHTRTGAARWRGLRGERWRDALGGFGGGSLEHPRRWRGAQWAGLFLRVPSCLEPPGAPLRYPEEAQEPSWGAA